MAIDDVDFFGLHLVEKHGAEEEAMGVRCFCITANANRSDVALSQHVRLVGESSKSNQANCVDGSVLIASVLEKIGIETDLVKVPGQMFVRF